MIVTKTPLRISMFGGSTDNPFFVKKFGYGSVISFACDLKTYVTLSQDKFGYNQHNHKYILNYSKREEVNSLSNIKNELVRLVMEHFDVPPLNISLTSDVFSHGSGLASSSSYFISLIKAVSIFKGLSLTDAEICSLALELEQKINPYCGYQDPYGCGIGGFKRMEFYDNGSVKHEFLPTELFNVYDTHLIFTGVTRNSKIVLKNISNNIDKISPLIHTVNLAHEALIDKDYDMFMNFFNKSWSQKKNTSDIITKNNTIKDMDNELSNNPTVVGHKLCGAGNGGFFLVFSHKDTLNISYEYVKINVSPNGVEGEQL